jgi:MFS family permease
VSAPRSPGPASLVDPLPLLRRTLRVIGAAQFLGGAGLSAGVVVGALLAEDLLGGSEYAGLPAAVLTLGAALSAVLLGRVSDRWGRRAGLAAGYAGGAGGAAVAVFAAQVRSFPLLLLAMLAYGAGTAASLQARFAAADLAPPALRGRSIGVALFATTFGAIAAPNVVTPTGTAARALGLPRLAGPFLLAVLAYAAAALVLGVLLRPDPLIVARRLAAAEAPDVGLPAGAAAPTVLAALRAPGAMAGVLAMVITQLVMVAVMTMTPVHLRAHGHGLSVVGVVIGAHIAGMYLPSPVSGWLADRAGYGVALTTGGVALVLSGLTAAAAGGSPSLLLLALFLLGVGWNLGLLAGTALLAESVPLPSRARTQGVADLCVGLSGAVGGLSSGLVQATAGFGWLAAGGAAVSVLLLMGGRWAPAAGRATG